MHAEALVGKRTYAGLFMVTLATLMYEILLTRIFSVTMWYHFAFMAVSIAMFGMTVGALLVYLLPNYFTQERAKYHLALSSLLFAVSTVVSFLTQLSIPFRVGDSIVSFYSIAFTYLVISLPFVLSGICVSLALTRFSRQVSKLYAADLAGAAVGGIVLVGTLKITDGPTAVVVVALFASVGAALFAAGEGSKGLARAAMVSSLLLAIFAVGHTALVDRQYPLLRLMWVKGEFEPRPLYEKWNPFARIRVFEASNEPFGWGLSPAYRPERRIEQLMMDIDASAATPLTAFNGDLTDIEFLKYDVTNFAHYLRPDSNVLVIGTGGGRDVLSALVFGQKSVLGVEINEDIIDAVNHRFGDFTGHLDRYPGVTFVNDEARSYVTRLEDKFDIIQASLIDTWAATTAGAFVLSENSLYTVEAWKVFLEHLTPNGIITFSRWYSRGTPGEVYRLASLATASLMQLGVANPRDHIVIVKNTGGEARDAPVGIGTILVSREPFSAEDLDIVESVARRMEFDVILTPRVSADSTLATIASGRDLDGFAATFPVNIAAPTDDNPFFFNMLRLRDVLNGELREQWGVSHNMNAVVVLGALLIIVLGLTFLGIIIPLILTTDRRVVAGNLSFFVFFASIGLGFMLVEISQMQRLIVFLGHPTYGLLVVLFALLLSSSLGSYLTQRIGDRGSARWAIMCLSLLLVSLVVFGAFTPQAIAVFRGSTTELRILVAVGILFPLGVFMGMPFPLGMRAASSRSASLTPWLWGINGATSVCASVFAVIVALNGGISASFWLGFVSYLLASLAFVWSSRGKG